MFHRQPPVLIPSAYPIVKAAAGVLMRYRKQGVVLLLMLGLGGCASLGGGTPPESQAYGIWTGRLPCADCPGIDTRLVLWRAPDRFRMTETYRDSETEQEITSGHWLVERVGAIPALGRLKLTSGGGGRTLYLERLPTGNLRLLDQDGGAQNSTLDHVLERTRANAEES